MFPKKMVIGFDRGNHMTDICSVVVVDGKITLAEYENSSAICEGDLKTLQAFSESSAVSSEKRGDTEMIVTYKNIPYFLGHTALQQGVSPSTDIGNRNRYGDENTLIALLGFSATLLKRIYPGETSADISIVMGMPILTCTEENKNAVRQALNGHHQFVFNGTIYHFHITILAIMMEGAGGAITHGTSDAGKIIGYLDTGGLTTNALQYEGTKALIQKCKSIDIGMEDIGRRVNNEISTIYQRELDSGELNKVFRTYTGEFSTYPELSALKNKRRVIIEAHHLHAAVEAAVEAAGKALRSFLSQVWNDNAQGTVAGKLWKVYYVGGGAKLLKPEAEKLLGEVIVPDNHRKANVRGYASRAYTVTQALEQRKRTMAS